MLKVGYLERLTKLMKLLIVINSEKNREGKYNIRNENQAITRCSATLKTIKGYYEQHYAHIFEI